MAGEYTLLTLHDEGALKGKLIIDLTRVLGGPYCTQILADHGAEVIKIEPPRGDETREWGPPFHDEDSPYFLGVNRNKRAITLDLERPEGRELLLQLVSTANAVVENYSGSVLPKLNLGYDVFRQENEKIINKYSFKKKQYYPYGQMQENPMSRTERFTQLYRVG